MLQGVVVYVDDLIIFVDDLIILLSILNIVEKYHMFPKFHLLKPNGAGSLFHGILVCISKYKNPYCKTHFIEPAKSTGSMTPLFVCSLVR